VLKGWYFKKQGEGRQEGSWGVGGRIFIDSQCMQY